MTPLTSELARKQPAEIVTQQPRPAVIDGESRPAHSMFARKENRAFKWIALLFLAFGLFGYVIATLQTL